MQPIDCTTTIETNLLALHLTRNRTIRWNEITFLDSWKIPSMIILGPIVNQDINQIIKTSKRDVEIRYNPQRQITFPKISVSSNNSTQKGILKEASIISYRLERIKMSNNQLLHPQTRKRSSPKQIEVCFNFNGIRLYRISQESFNQKSLSCNMIFEISTVLTQLIKNELNLF